MHPYAEGPSNHHDTKNEAVPSSRGYLLCVSRSGGFPEAVPGAGSGALAVSAGGTVGSVQTGSASEVLCTTVYHLSLPSVLDALLQIAASLRLGRFPLHASGDSCFCCSQT